MLSRFSSLARFYIVVVGLAALLAGTTDLAFAQGQYQTPDWFFLGKFQYNPKENYEVTPHQYPGTIPPDILALNGKKVIIPGIPTPLDFKDGYATRFFFVGVIDACGFGTTPRINEWIDVVMKPGVKVKSDRFMVSGQQVEVNVYGTFSIKEEVDPKDKKVTALFHMVAEKLE